MEISNLTIREASKLLKKGDLTVKDLVSAYVDRAKEKNPEYNAFLEIYSDDFINSQVEKAQSMIDAGEGNELFIKFNIKSDEYVEFDGWYIDDIQVKIFTKKLTGISGSKTIPNKNYLEQNYPNPFNPSTEINFQIAENGFVNLTIYNVLGQEVAKLVNKNMTAGNHSISFDASNLTGGVYFYKLMSDRFSQVKKMLLIK